MQPWPFRNHANCTHLKLALLGQSMGGSRKNFRGGKPNIVGIKVVQLNVLLELQLKTLLVISHIPV